DEKQVVGIDVPGRKQPVRGSAGVCWHRLWGVCPGSGADVCRPASPGGCLCDSPSWSGIHLGLRILVSGWTSLDLARRLLGASALCSRPLDCSALLRRPLLWRILAPVVT